MLEKPTAMAVSLLRWSEKYTRMDMLYVAKGGFWVLLGQITSSVLSLVLIVVFANLLPKETYGMYRYVLSLASMLNIFTLLGMNQSVAQAVATGNEGILRPAVRYQLLWNTMAIVAFFGLSAYYFFNGNGELSLALLLLSVSMPVTSALNTYGAFLQGKREFRLDTIFSTITTIIYVIGMLFAIVLSGEVVWLVAAYSFTTFIGTLTFYFVTLRTFNPKDASDPEVLRYGRELTYINFIGPIVGQIDKIILTHFWGASQLAVYALAAAIPDKAIPLVKNWVGISFPKLAERTPEEIQSMLYRRIFQGLSVGLVLTIGYVIVSPFVFTYLLPQYLDAILYSQLLAISFIFAIPTRYLGLLFAAKKLSRLAFASNLVQNIIRIVLFVILGIWGGILGLIIAQLLGALNGLLINLYVWQVYGRSKT